MEKEWVETAGTLFKEIVRAQREIISLLLEVRSDVSALNDRLDRLEKSLVAGREASPDLREPPQ